MTYKVEKIVFTLTNSEIENGNECCLITCDFYPPPPENVYGDAEDIPECVIVANNIWTFLMQQMKGEEVNREEAETRRDTTVEIFSGLRRMK